MSMEVEAKDPPAASSAGRTSTGKHHVVFSMVPDSLRKLDATAPVTTWEDCGGNTTEFVSAWLAYGRGRGWEYFLEVDSHPVSAAIADIPDVEPESLEVVKKEYENACRPDKAVSSEDRQLARKEYLRARLRLKGKTTNIPRYAAIVGGRELPEPLMSRWSGLMLGRTWRKLLSHPPRRISPTTSRTPSTATLRRCFSVWKKTYSPVNAPHVHLMNLS